jgi:hypothetical protein
VKVRKEQVEERKEEAAGEKDEKRESNISILIQFQSIIVFSFCFISNFSSLFHFFPSLFLLRVSIFQLFSPHFTSSGERERRSQKREMERRGEGRRSGKRRRNEKRKKEKEKGREKGERGKEEERKRKKKNDEIK